MIELLHLSSKILKNERRVFVFLPPGCSEGGGRTFPVLYMQDGQNLFANVCHEVPWQWELDRVVTDLIERRRLQPLIVVGLANTPHREDEYTMTRDARMRRGGRADAYLDFVTQEALPFIRARFPVNPLRTATAFGGSSLGGLLALYAACTRSESFGSFLAVSPSVWWDSFRIFKLIESSPMDPARIRLWVDIGKREMKGRWRKKKLHRPLAIYRFLDQALRAKGFGVTPGYRYVEDRLGRHDERWWGRRMRAALPFAFPRSAHRPAGGLLGARAATPVGRA